MPPEMEADALLCFTPKVFYPYHFNGTVSRESHWKLERIKGALMLVELKTELCFSGYMRQLYYERINQT